jgi:hypothetical protein
VGSQYWEKSKIHKQLHVPDDIEQNACTKQMLNNIQECLEKQKKLPGDIVKAKAEELDQWGGVSAGSLIMGVSVGRT